MGEDAPGAEPGKDFQLLGGEPVGEGNWEWIQAEGFRPYWTGEVDEQQQRELLTKAYDDFGIDNVRVGARFDSESSRPLRHAPGTTIYVRDPAQGS